jgi:hypothetical protein
MLERRKRPKWRGHMKIRELPAEYSSLAQKNPRVWGADPGTGVRDAGPKTLLNSCRA